MYKLAGITRGKYRKWGKLLSPALSPVPTRHPTYTPAQTFAICVLAELMHSLDSGAKHLAGISPAFFDHCCSDDWRRLEHRYLVLVITVEPGPKGKPVGRPTFRTIPKSEPVPKADGTTVVTLDLAPFVQRMNRFLNGVQPEVPPEQMSFLERRKSKQLRDQGNAEPGEK